MVKCKDSGLASITSAILIYTTVSIKIKKNCNDCEYIAYLFS